MATEPTPSKAEAQAARTAMRRLQWSAREALADAERTGEEIEELAARPSRRAISAFGAGFGVGTALGALAALALRRRP